MAKKELTAPRSVNHGPRRTHMNPLTLLQGDCLDLMKTIPDGSIDMVMCDLPYGTTACKWDSVIPFEPLWEQYRRVCKKNAAIVLTASQPFTSALVMSNVSDFRYCWVWDKVNRNTGALTANKMPMKRHEDVVVFYRILPTYNKQFVMKPRISGGRRTTFGEHNGHGPARASDDSRKASDEDVPHNPFSILSIKADEGQRKSIHPTQKPVALMEYLIKTYTNPGETVLDNTMGSGTTGVACMNIGRRFVGIERDPDYFKIAESRIHEAALKAFEI